MDLDFLPKIVMADDEGQWPSAERALRLIMDPPSFSYRREDSRNPMRAFPQISDPIGIVRSLNSIRSGPGPGTYRKRVSFLDREDKQPR